MNRFDTWSDRKLAAQCIFPRLDCDKYLEDAAYSEQIKKLVKLDIGGFCIFNGTTETVKNILAELQILSNIPLLFCADFENGVTMRLEDGTDFPHAMALGKTGEYTSRIAAAIAKEAKDLGVFWNLAPVCDINSNPKNPVINIRSFGETSKIAAKNAKEYVKGTQEENVLACAKHFPGHGNTNIDSHRSLPIINFSSNEQFVNELAPFYAAMSCDVKSIMIGHLIVENLDRDYPASLSKKIITDLLRNRLKFNGIIITDALDMKAVADKYSIDEIIELVFNAGNDVFLMPNDPLKALSVLTKIVESDYNNRVRIEQSVNRLYNAKRWCKLIPQYAKYNDKSKAFVEHQKTALKAALQAVEIHGSDKNLIPIPEKDNFAVFSILQKAEDVRSATRFYTMLSGAVENDCDFSYIDETIKDEELIALQEQIKDAKFIIFNFFFRGRGYSDLGNPEKLNNIIKKLALGRDYITIFFGDPYLADYIDSKLKIITFSDSFPSLAAAVMKVAGRTLPENY